VKIPYMAVPRPKAIPSLGGQRVRYRPITAIRLIGPTSGLIRDGLLDTGADDTVFPEETARLLGIDLDQAEERQIVLAARVTPIRCRYAPVQIHLTDGRDETYEWTAVVAFVSARLHYNLLGHAGFLQYFGAFFDGEARQVTLTPRPSFPGHRAPSTNY